LSETLQAGRIRFDMTSRLWSKCMCAYSLLWDMAAWSTVTQVQR